MSTMADVAKEARVSVATVSRLLNNLGTVSPETAERVYAAISKLSYEPNLLARNLRKNESRVILLLAPNVTNPYYAHILSGIGDAAANLGYSALIFTTADDLSREREGLEMLKRHRVDGAILMASNLGGDWLLEYANQFPVVQCSEFDPSVDIPHVSIDNYQAAVQTMDYLLSLGHTRIAMVSSENQYLSTNLRLRGYRDTLATHGIEVREDYIAYAAPDYSFTSGKARTRDLMNVDPRPTAIFCISDTLALGAITAAREMGFRVPENVTVIGFDDVEDTTKFHPYITTVSQPCYELGRQSMQLLYSLMSQAKDVPHQVVLPHRLIVRESSAASPKLD
ncbi:MAG: LacI family DNA-binding transcriptional regulator [Anaerolineaceae bacterium]